MRKQAIAILFIVCFALGAVQSESAEAVTLDFSGNLAYHNDIYWVSFSLLKDLSRVSIWTDSFNYGESFDPVIDLWTSNDELIVQNNDIDYEEILWDAAVFVTLASGNYSVSIAASENLALGPFKMNGFVYDGEGPEPIEEWNGGWNGYWHLNISAEPVPEPSTLIFVGSGLLWWVAFRIKKKVGI